MRNIVVLTNDELRKASILGLDRWLRAVRYKRQPRHGDTNRNPMNHIQGAWGEWVISKVTGYPVKWTPRTDDGEPDVGPWHVRTGGRPSHRLMLHDGYDYPDQPYVLVVPLAPGTFQIVGWCWGYEGMVPEYMADPVGDRPAYFVPQTFLRPWDEKAMRAA